jgi:hypothetical protein
MSLYLTVSEMAKVANFTIPVAFGIDVEKQGGAPLRFD